MVNGHVTHSAGAPAGIRISYPALAIVVTILLGAGGVVGSIRRNDLEGVDKAIAAVRVAQASDLARLERRLERIEDKVDELRAPTGGGR